MEVKRSNVENEGEKKLKQDVGTNSLIHIQVGSVFGSQKGGADVGSDDVALGYSDDVMERLTHEGGRRSR
jgi:hypothetical protein